MKVPYAYNLFLKEIMKNQTGDEIPVSRFKSLLGNRFKIHRRFQSKIIKDMSEYNLLKFIDFRTLKILIKIEREEKINIFSH